MQKILDLSLLFQAELMEHMAPFSVMKMHTHIDLVIALSYEPAATQAFSEI